MSDEQRKNKGGRPTKYTPEMAERICDLIASTDLGYNVLHDMYPDLPARANVNLWRRKYPEFRAMYAQAKSEQIEFLTEEILEIADNATNDWMEYHDKENDCIGWKVNGDHVQRSRLRIDTRKWLASKLVPRMYGDKTTVESTHTIKHEDSLKELE